MSQLNNKFKVEYDSQPYQVIDDINSILKERFGIQIECLSPDDAEISIIKQK